MAGINAARYVQELEPLFHPGSDACIGVLIGNLDLSTREPIEPVPECFTSKS